MASYALLANLKIRLGITTVDADRDTILQLMLDAATLAIDNFCNTTFATVNTVASEVHDGDGSRYLQLRFRPITTVTTVTMEDSAVSSDDYEVQAREGFLVFPETNEYNPRTRITGNRWLQGDQNIDVAYEYGTASVPKPIELACLRLASLWYRQQSGVKSERMGPRDLTWSDAEGGAMPVEVRGMLSAYVEQGVIG